MSILTKTTKDERQHRLHNHSIDLCYRGWCCLEFTGSIKQKKEEMKDMIEYLAPYLPYGVKFQFWHSENDNGIFTLGIDNIAQWDDRCSLILRPLSDLTKEIEHNGERFVPERVLGETTTIEYTDEDILLEAGFDGRMHELDKITYLSYCQVQKLFEWHFDVFGLIEQGKAISIHDL